MKTCTYCGGQNDDAASACAHWGTVLRGSELPEEDALPLHLDPVGRFRTLVVLSTICFILLVIGPWIFWRDLSQETYEGLSWRGFHAVLPVPAIVFYITAVLWVGAAIGVYYFVPAALWLYTALIVYGMATTLLSGMDTRLAVESFLIFLTNLADGAILTLAYCTPLRNKFKSPAAEDPDK